MGIDITPSGLGTGKRFNEGKTRHDLTPAWAQEQYARVLTAGAVKYGEGNWEKGMAWSKVIASMERHLQAIKRNQDFDPETGELHSAHIMCNAAFLTEYYRIFPQGDDRRKSHIAQMRVALDVDEVIADWVGHWCAYFRLDRPESWTFDRSIGEKFEIMKSRKDFWLSIPPLVNPSEIPFEPVCYITSRVIPSEWTAEWLDICKFPAAPVVTVGHGESKVDVLRENKVDIYVDDRFENFFEINQAGILCYLMDAPHNRRYDVGHKRIGSLKELAR